MHLSNRAIMRLSVGTVAAARWICDVSAPAEEVRMTLLCTPQKDAQMHITIDGDQFGVTRGRMQNGWELISRGVDAEPGRILLRAYPKEDLLLEVDRLTFKVFTYTGAGSMVASAVEIWT
jgi:hypothetical protein